ncbi:MAG TPA: class I SAM-dependent methyltransferase [Actinocrinis sp.]|nr:class I SAM-dependent methyltransferase [Actinocrinis sp.]
MDLTGQFALPRGLAGKLVGRLMAKRHVAQVQAIVAEVAPAAGESVLEIGFGPGTGLVALARAAPQARIAGIDPSALMVAEARRRVRKYGQRRRRSRAFQQGVCQCRRFASPPEPFSAIAGQATMCGVPGRTSWSQPGQR